MFSIPEESDAQLRRVLLRHGCADDAERCDQFATASHQPVGADEERQDGRGGNAASAAGDRVVVVQIVVSVRELALCSCCAGNTSNDKGILVSVSVILLKQSSKHGLINRNIYRYRLHVNILDRMKSWLELNEARYKERASFTL